MSKMPYHPEAFSNDRAQNRRPKVPDGGFLDFIRGLPGLTDGAEAEAAHVRYASPRHGKPSTGAGRRPDDRWAVPLSPAAHRLYATSQHGSNERQWWFSKGIDPLVVAALLFSHYHAGDPHAAHLVCMAARDGAFPPRDWS